MHRMLQGVLYLENCYEVHLGREAAGKVQLLRQGLYYRVICRCSIPGEQICRLFAIVGDRRENIGVMVPEGDGFVLDKQIPAKRLEGEPLRFTISSGATQCAGEFVPISPEEPFLYIDRLKTAFLSSEHGKIGIIAEKRPEAVS